MAQDKYIDGFIEKLNEWGKSEELCEMVIDTYTTALTKEGWEEDDILRFYLNKRQINTLWWGNKKPSKI
jgi:sulfur relay (sulfurtransferase) DsrC/TusE family protein